MELRIKQREVVLEGGNEMEAVALACESFARRRKRALSETDLQYFVDLYTRAYDAEFTPPDRETGEKRMTMSKHETQIAIRAAQNFRTNPKYDDVFPTVTKEIIARIAHLSFEDVCN
ncbi:hypothetical protein [Mycobacteroides abscessus]|uniref:hypothetical protein n=1 Tax=Mycobacteroides abscessus TaxID=36809 RepID=UPI0012FFEF30|nr:hypothetical protein [Mycobacteroides abscessus]